VRCPHTIEKIGASPERISMAARFRRRRRPRSVELMTNLRNVRSACSRVSRRWLSPTLFALIALCFFLPFATVSCDSARTSFTGVQLVTHTVPKGGRVDEAPDCAADLSTCVEHEASFTAAVALLSAIVGLLLGLFAVSKGPGWFASVTFGALVTLALEPFDLFGPDVTLHAGMELALLLSAWAVALHGRRAWRRRHGARCPEDGAAVSAALEPAATLAGSRNEPQGGTT